MIRASRSLILLCLLIVCSACNVKATPTPPPTPSPSPTPVPTATVEPSPTPYPTASELAPEETFATVGNTAAFSGAHGVTGKAIVAGLQTLIIQGFYYDGKGVAPDIRLVLGDDYANPAAVLMVLEQRAYVDETLYMIVPSAAGPGTADSIAIYSPETGEVYASQSFG